MENFPKTTNKHESREGEPVAELEAAVNQLNTHATRLEREGSDVDISEETSERIGKRVGKIRNLLKVASMGLALFGSIKVGEEVKDYTTSRYEITSHEGSDGNIEYEHEDPETTRILKFLTGAAELAPEDRLHFYRELVRGEVREKLQSQKRAQELGSLQSNDLEIMKKAGTLSIEELNAMESSLSVGETGLKLRLRDIYSEQDILLHGKAQDDIDTRVDKAFANSIEAGVDYNPVIESLVWNMQKKVGAPRIRWAAPTDNDKAKIVGHAAGAGRAFYSSVENTVYITPDSSRKALGSYLLAENAHADQFNNHPVSSRVRNKIDEVKLQIRGIREDRSRYEVQLDEYDTPGNIEHEAHEIIEKRLMNEWMEEKKRL